MKRIYMILGVLALTFLFICSPFHQNNTDLSHQSQFKEQSIVLEKEDDIQPVPVVKDEKEETKDEPTSNKNSNKSQKTNTEKESKKKKQKPKGKIYKVNLPTYNQKTQGYPRGCEGVSLYMCLKGKGYIKSMSLKDFMNTMPLSYDDNPNNGYVGDPTKGKNDEVNKGKRTTIHPLPLSKWGSQFGICKNFEGQSVQSLINELKKGNPIVVWVTSSWNTPKYATYSFGRTISNNHATCLVGYNEATNQFLINDCSSKNTGEYWIERSVFEKTYNPRKYAVVVG